MNIGIAGCGITGTTVGHLLAEQGHSVSIFEQAEVCRPVGAGILLQPTGQQILQQLGLFDSIAAVSSKLDGLTANLVSGRGLVRLKYEWLNRELFGLGVHRGTLFEMLMELCDKSGVQVHTDSKAAKVQSDDRWATIVLEDGRQVEGVDFVIAADGSRSALRGSSGIPTHIAEYGYAALWATGPCDYQPESLVQIVDGTHYLVGILPIGEGRASFFWGLPTDGFEELTSKPMDSWKRDVVEICPDVASLLEHLHSFSDLTFATYRHVSMKRWFDNRVVFLGDAAHATSPHLGQGVNLALEDAVAFAQALQSTDDFQSACQKYTHVRRSKLRYYSQLTRFLSPFFQSHGKVRGKLRDIFLPWFPRTPFVRREMIRTLCGYKGGWIW